MKVTIRKAIRPLTVLFCLWLAPSWTWAVQTEVHIGVLAKRGYEKSLERWNATAEYLNETLPAYHFNIIPMAFDDIQVVVKNRMVDFVIVNPGIYADLSVKYGVRRILTLVNELSGNSRISQFGSVIFTLNSNSDIQQLADLENQRVAAVHHTSLGGWIMALRELHTVGLETWDLGSLLFLNTHDAVVKAVLNREAEVGIVRSDTLERIAQEGNLNLHNLRVIAPRRYDHFPYAISTPLYPEWPFSQLPNTSQTLARDVSIALLKLPADHPAARDARIHGWTIPENYQTVHDLLMLLEMPPYEKKLPEKFIDSLVRAWHWYLTVALILLFLIFLGLRVIRLNRSLTESKKTLEDSIEAQIATFEQAAVGLAHVTLTGRFLRMNWKLGEIAVLSRQQMEKTNLKEMLHRDDIPLCISAFDQLRGNKKSSVSTQLRMLCGNGENKWIQLSLSKKPNGNSHETYLVAVIDDIDKYKKLEEESRRVQQQKELILDIAGDGILGLDDQANHVFVNPAAAEMLGYSIDEMLQKNSHALWHHSREDGSEYPESECPITNVLRLGKIHRGAKETVWRKDGTPLQIEFISTPIKEAGRITGAVVVFHQTVSDTKDDATSPPES